MVFIVRSLVAVVLFLTFALPAWAFDPADLDRLLSSSECRGL